MGWRIVKQPNGKLARFSDIVDDFTDMNMTEEDAFNECRDRLGIEDSKQRIQAALEDWKPWTVGVLGNGSERWEDSINTVRLIHGESAVQDRLFTDRNGERW